MIFVDRLVSYLSLLSNISTRHPIFVPTDKNPSRRISVFLILSSPTVLSVLDLPNGHSQFCQFVKPNL